MMPRRQPKKPILEDRMLHNRRYMSWVAALFAVMLVAAACGTGAGAADDAAEQASEGTGGEEQNGTGRAVIRFAFAPDPVWDYLNDTGELAQWEEDNNIRIVTSQSWDEFAYFAGGHGDVVSIGTQELPVLEEETGVKVVAFGQYKQQRVPLLRKAGDPYETLADVPEGSTTCANSAVSNTIVWSIIADQLHDIDYRVGEGRFNIVLQDHFAMPELVVGGECTVAAAIPEAAVSLLRSGELEIMYGGRPPWRIYQEDICQCDHKGVMSNLFVATEEWYDAHPEQAAAFLGLWERGLQLWEENREEIIALYPQHFAVETEEDTEYMIEFMSGDNDWFADTVYMDEAWMEEEKNLYEYMVESGWMEDGTEIPRFEAVNPPS
jgi:ABC-type nitrate/sulfonate/bicarbonate transport system substrate-binding protein